jgi:hypothetical protein
VRQAWRAGRLVDPQLAVAAVAGAGTQDSASALLSTAEVLLRHICPHIVRGAAHHAAPGRQAGSTPPRPGPAPVPLLPVAHVIEQPRVPLKVVDGDDRI